MTVITASKAGGVLQVNDSINEVVRIPIHNMDEMDFYSDRGVTIYRNKITHRNGNVSMCYFIEVFIEDLAKIAR
jgi:hypothetical protein